MRSWDGYLCGWGLRVELCRFVDLGRRGEWRFLDVTGEIARIDLIYRGFAVIWVHRPAAAEDRPVVLIFFAVAGLEDNLSSGRRRLCRSNSTACSSAPRDLGGVTAPLTAGDSLILTK